MTRSYSLQLLQLIQFFQVLSWDPVAEVWSVAGHLELARQRHGVAVVEMGGIVSNFCFS